MAADHDKRGKRRGEAVERTATQHQAAPRTVKPKTPVGVRETDRENDEISTGGSDESEGRETVPGGDEDEADRGEPAAEAGDTEGVTARALPAVR